MNVQAIVKIDGRKVADFQEEVSTQQALELEQCTEQLKDRMGRVVPEVGSQKRADLLRHWCSCVRPMRKWGKRLVTVTSESDPLSYESTRDHSRNSMWDDDVQNNP